MLINGILTTYFKTSPCVSSWTKQEGIAEVKNEDKN